MKITADMLRKLHELGLDLEQAAGVIELFEAEAAPPLRIKTDDLARALGVGREAEATRRFVPFDSRPSQRSHSTVMSFPGVPLADPDESAEEGFRRFWDAYPKKVHKGRALKAYIALASKMRFADIMQNMAVSSDVKDGIEASKFLADQMVMAEAVEGMARQTAAMPDSVMTPEAAVAAHEEEISRAINQHRDVADEDGYSNGD